MCLLSTTPTRLLMLQTRWGGLFVWLETQFNRQHGLNRLQPLKIPNLFVDLESGDNLNRQRSIFKYVKNHYYF
ncbi:hypothetical protein AYR62_06075 [Secundilactobacillus paracollinoides]|nr:hypothetical protein AYR62_06075 [Secundilactobacillus paracollinoides]